MPVAIDEAFTVPECRAIRALAPADPGRGPVWTGAAYGLDPAQRHVAMSLIARGTGCAWLHDRIDHLFETAAARIGVAVAPAAEPLQLLRYDEGCHFQAWHTDGGLDAIDRRLLSASIELSDPGDYDGGDLEVAPMMIGARRRARGSACIFLSRMLHHVTPVTRGTRWALVAWAGARPA